MKYFDAVGQATSTSGTGAMTLTGVISSEYFSFAERGAVDGDKIYYRIDEGGNVEIGKGTFSGSATVLSRDTVLESRIGDSAGTTKMTLAGGAQVRCVYPSEIIGLITKMSEVIKTNDYTISVSDAGKQMIANKATAINFGLPAVGDSDSEPYFFRNIGVGALTIDPDSSEQIEDAANLVLQIGDSAIIWPNAGKTAWRAAVTLKPSGDVRADRATSRTDGEKTQARTNITSGIRTITGADSITVADWGKTILFNSATAITVTLSAVATLGDGFWCKFKNIAAGVVTLDPNSSETIDGLTTLDVAQYGFGELHCTGSVLHTLDRQGATLGTVQATTSGTSKTFSIPVWTRLILIPMAALSTNGGSLVQVQIGDSGGIETSGYTADSSLLASGSVAQTAHTAGFGVSIASASASRNGFLMLAMVDPANNTWAMIGILGDSGLNAGSVTAGAKSLSDPLTSVMITTVNGTDTLDAGKANVICL